MSGAKPPAGRPRRQQSAATSVLYGGNAAYLEQLRDNPSAAPASWRDFFAGEAAARGKGGGSGDGSQLAVSRLIDAYRQYGCRSAELDPLGYDDRIAHPGLDPASWGLGAAHRGNSYVTDIPGCEQATLDEIINCLQESYCGRITAEYMHTPSTEVKKWFIDNFEASRGKAALAANERRMLLQKVVAADALERYLNTRFTGQKRFSLEGGDGLIPMLDVMLVDSVKDGYVEAVIGMAHRGRLNVLINILGKSPTELFEEFEGKAQISFGSGDVKYHQGFSSQLHSAGDEMHLALMFNPSHLEIVNPVVEGSVRARQDRRNDHDGATVLPVLIHGDAAVSGQGVVMETLQMSQLEGYRTGGTVHIVVNNQIGFTTSQRDDVRSTYWCTDIAKMVDAPVLHVNGDDPEAGIQAMRLALAYRRRFAADIFIDLICFRRHGHNEQDEPMVTQPFMYRHVKKHPGPAQVYAQRLTAEGVIKDGEFETMRREYADRLDSGKPANDHIQPAATSKFVDWSKFAPGDTRWDVAIDTGAPAAKLREYAAALTRLPDGFEVHPRVASVLKARREMGAGNQPIDWGMAENLAYAALLDEGYPVRISGQDVGRGTFFHRHAALHDQKRGQRAERAYFPLKHLKDAQPRFDCIDSLLSEEAVLGFEYGYSTTNPNALVIWEAQFGDFANGAQVIIDQFISSGEFKWGRLCNLVLLLPHGYEGQGPEHSSARLERYLQLCAEYNMQVCVPSTAAQVFHLLRRQILRPMRRPLIVMSPKSLLRHKEVGCSIDDLASGRFQALLPESDAAIKPAKVSKLLVCCGKIYYELRAEREKRKINDIAIVRIEQLYPFPHEQFDAQIKRYKNLKTVCWCQEEPGNQGAYHRIMHYLRRHMHAKHEFKYALRPSSASTAAGKPALHRRQQEEIIEAALLPVENQR